MKPKSLSAANFGEWVVTGCLHAFEAITKYFLVSSYFISR